MHLFLKKKKRNTIKDFILSVSDKIFKKTEDVVINTHVLDEFIENKLKPYLIVTYDIVRCDNCNKYQINLLSKQWKTKESFVYMCINCNKWYDGIDSVDISPEIKKEFNEIHDYLNSIYCVIEYKLQEVFQKMNKNRKITLGKTSRIRFGYMMIPFYI